MLSQSQGTTAWEYTIVHTDRLNTPSGPQLAPIWRRPYADGSTDWDQINKLGEDGWEMVNAFPVEANGTVLYLAFVFKRPRRAPLPPPALPAPEEGHQELNDSGGASPAELGARGAGEGGLDEAAANDNDDR